MAKQEGLTEETVGKIRDDHARTDLTPRQKAALGYTDVFLQDPAVPPEALRRELLAHFTPEQIVELTAGIALFMGFSKLALALGEVPDDLPVHEEPTPDWPAAGGVG